LERPEQRRIKKMCVRRAIDCSKSKAKREEEDRISSKSIKTTRRRH
jgi:hypothetical protein